MKTIEIKAPPRYQKQGSEYGSLMVDRVYQSLCFVLSDRIQEIAWEEFGPQHWQLLGKMARIEEVAPLIYWKLKSQWPERMPKNLREDLTQAYFKNSGRNLWLFAELERVLIALGNAGIPVIVLKGAALAATVYEDPALRIMCDIDLLVPEGLCGTAVDVVKALGYIEFIPEFGPGFNQKLGHNIKLTKPGNPEIKLEIHWTLVAGSGYIYSAPVDWFWRQTEECFYGKGTIKAKMLNPTASLLFLTVHAMLQHGGSQVTLRSLYDIDRLIVVLGDKIDWKFVVCQGQEFGWTGALLVALEKSKDMFNTPVIEEFIKFLPTNGPFQFLLDMKQTPAETKIIVFRRILSDLKWTSRWHMAVSLLIPSPAFMRWRYKPRPVWLWPLTYYYRWIGFGWDIIRNIFNSKMTQG